jgi:hypothetical protein
VGADRVPTRIGARSLRYKSRRQQQKNTRARLRSRRPLPPRADTAAQIPASPPTSDDARPAPGGYLPTQLACSAQLYLGIAAAILRLAVTETLRSVPTMEVSADSTLSASVRMLLSWWRVVALSGLLNAVCSNYLGEPVMRGLQLEMLPLRICFALFHPVVFGITSVCRGGCSFLDKTHASRGLGSLLLRMTAALHRLTLDAKPGALTSDGWFNTLIAVEFWPCGVFD